MAAAAAMFSRSGDSAVAPELEDAARCQDTGISFQKRTKGVSGTGAREIGHVVGAIGRDERRLPTVTVRSCDDGQSSCAQTKATHLGNLHGAISRAGECARRAQAGPCQHGRHTLRSLGGGCRGSIDYLGNSLPPSVL